MNRFFALIRVSFLGLLKSFSFGGKKKVAGAGSLVLMVVLCLYVSGIYSMLFSSLLAPAGLIGLMPLLMAVFSVLMSFMLTLFAGSGILFGGKDADFVLALPVSVFEILLSKILALYLENLLLTLLMMLPCGVFYLCNGGAGGAGFLLLLVVGTLFLTLIPTFFGVVVGYLVAWVTARSQKKTLFSVLLYILFFFGVMVFSFRLNAGLNALVQNADAVYAVMNSWLLPIGLFGKACGGNLLALAGLAAITCGPLLLVIWLFSRGYKATLSRMGSRTVRRDYKLTAVAGSSPFAALYKKELKRLFSSAMYLLNSCFGGLSLLFLCGFAFVKRRELLNMLALFGEEMPLFPMLVAMVAALVGTVCTTSVSISLEGNRLWLLKSLPVETETIFRVKIALNLTITVPVILISTVALGALVGLGAGQILLGVVSCTVYSLFLSLFGLMVNLKFPKLDADNDAVVVKQSLSSMIGVFGGMVLAVVVGILYGVLSGFVSFELYLTLAVIVFALLSALCAKWLSGRGKRAFLQL